MVLVPIDSLRRQVIEILKKTDPPGGVELLSYKRDRSIGLICRQDRRYQVIERGFTEQEYVVDAADLTRVLKAMIKREFPRSRTVRLCKFSTPSELERQRQRI